MDAVFGDSLAVKAAGSATLAALGKSDKPKLGSSASLPKQLDFDSRDKWSTRSFR